MKVIFYNVKIVNIFRKHGNYKYGLKYHDNNYYNLY
jgi:hypothetical protein